MDPNSAAPVVAQMGGQFVLPPQLYSLVEIHRVQRELEAIEEALRQQQTRASLAGTPLADMQPSELLQDLAAQNHYAITDAANRQQLISNLSAVAEKAPVIHVGLAADPPTSFVVAITHWLRANVHPLVLVRIGLQPSIAAGCIIRTTNKVFDMSLRHRFEQNTDKLIQALSGAKQ